MWLLLEGPTGHLRSHGQRVNNFKTKVGRLSLKEEGGGGGGVELLLLVSRGGEGGGGKGKDMEAIYNEKNLNWHSFLNIWLQTCLQTHYV